jgi:UDP-N-acetylmuramoylalanine--D-glutamate ligase
VSTLVLGAARSGEAIVRFLQRRGTPPAVVYDAGRGGAVEGVPITTGPWDPALLEGITRVVASPGFPEGGAPIADALAAGIPVLSEIELAFPSLDVPLVAVTGTNGKTTVTSLIDEMLRASGFRSAAVGNIGSPLCDAELLTVDVLVVETSSFQLRFIETFHPAVAVVLDVTEDHLDWHGSVEAYRSAKARITERQGPDDVLVHAADDPGAAGIASGSRASVIPVSGESVPDGGFGAERGLLHLPNGVVPTSGLDAAYRLDLVAAAVAATAMGAEPESIEQVVLGFTTGRHRREVVGRIDEVDYVNDSKATNPHAAAAALRAYPSVVAILGGRNKGLDLSPLLGIDQVRAVVAIGEAGEELAVRRPGTPVAGSMEEAVRRASQLAEPGDTVLLAPGCASFDMFDSYEARGDAFRDAVLGIMQARQ